MQNINIRFPIEDDKSTGGLFRLNKTTRDAVNTNLIYLFLSNIGGRYYRPRFGTNLLRFIFEPSDELTTSDIIEELNLRVSKYIPHVTIKDVDVQYFEGDEEKEGNTTTLQLVISFEYSDNAFTEQGEIELTF